MAALKLARILDTSVEALFPLPEDEPAPGLRTERVTVLPESELAAPGQHVQLCHVDNRMIASVPAPISWYVPVSDAVLLSRASATKAKAQIFHSEGDFSNRVLIAGCDPGVSVLARYLQAAGVELVLAHRNSSDALALLKAGCIHVAGTHLRDRVTGESNTPQISRIFRKNQVSVISFAIWEEGIVTATGNPKRIRGIEDLGRPDVSIVNREKGAGSRSLLDSSLKSAGIEPRMVQGYNRIVRGHLAAAWQVDSGLADCCIATRAAARVFGLGFVPLVCERYDLAILRRHLQLGSIQKLLDTLGRASFRRDLESLGGYDAKIAGQQVL
jgi:molybdate-binding protein